MGRKRGDQRYGAVIIGGDFHALGIARNLAGLDLPVIIVDSTFCIANFSKYAHRFFKCPPLSGESIFVDYLMDLGEEMNLEETVLFPGSDTAVHILSKNRDILKRYYLVPTPEWRITRIAYDKKLTYRLASEIGVPIPRTVFPEDADDLSRQELDFPVILKPAITANFYPVSHLKAMRADNRDELLRGYGYMSSIVDRSEIMVQEVIAGGPRNLYSFCSLFSGGEVKARIMGVRLRQHPMDFGSSSTYVVTCEVGELEELSTRMLKAMDYYGLSEVEFMFDERDSTFKLLDINPRTWGWHTLGARAGVNFSELLFRDMHNESVCLRSYEKGVRWIREVSDFPVAVTEIMAGRLRTGEYLRSLRGKKELAVFLFHDPLPFLVELFWAVYMWYKRGFRM